MPYDLSALQGYLRGVYFKKRVRQSRTKAILSRSLPLSAKTEMVHIVQNKVPMGPFFQMNNVISIVVLLLLVLHYVDNYQHKET